MSAVTNVSGMPGSSSKSSSAVASWIALSVRSCNVSVTVQARRRTALVTGFGWCDALRGEHFNRGTRLIGRKLGELSSAADCRSNFHDRECTDEAVAICCAGDESDRLRS